MDGCRQSSKPRRRRQAWQSRPACSPHFCELQTTWELPRTFPGSSLALYQRVMPHQTRSRWLLDLARRSYQAEGGLSTDRIDHPRFATRSEVLPPGPRSLELARDSFVQCNQLPGAWLRQRLGPGRRRVAHEPLKRCHDRGGLLGGRVGRDDLQFRTAVHSRVEGIVRRPVPELAGARSRFSPPRGLAAGGDRRTYGRRSCAFHAGEWVMPAKVYLQSPPFGDFRAMPARGERARAAEVDHLVSGQPAAGTADRDRRHLPLGCDHRRAADAARRAFGDRASNRRRRGRSDLRAWRATIRVRWESSVAGCTALGRRAAWRPPATAPASALTRSQARPSRWQRSSAGEPARAPRRSAARSSAA